MRWFHEGIDRLHVAITSCFVPPVFRHGIDSPLLYDHLRAVQLKLPPLTTEQRYALTAHTLVGDVVCGFQVRPGALPELPVVVYHHGLAEMPYDRTFRGIFRSCHPIRAHLAVIRAPFHHSWFEVFAGLSTLRRFLAMCAVAVRLIEAVRQLLINQGARGSLVAGTSLGGFLALMHHLVYGTADGYVPLLAGPDLAHVMLATHYRCYLDPRARAHSASIQALLDFRPAFAASDTRRVFPLLARYDLSILYAHHAACYAASGVPVVTIERGHITGACAFTALRTHVLTCLQTITSTGESHGDKTHA